MQKIILVIGARPNFMKAFPVYEALKNDFELTLIHTGQHFDEKMSDVFFNQLKFPKPDIYLTLESNTKAGELDNGLYVDNDEYLKNKDLVISDLINIDKNKSGQLGEIRDKLKIEFEKINPNLVIVFGDVTSTLAAGLAAKMLNIDLAHVESGLRSHDMKMPEEVNRILTDHITKYYFVTEQSGVDNLKEIGIIEHVYLVGNTMIDTQKKYLQQSLDTKYNEKLGVRNKEYILITLHRPSNVDDMDKLKEIFDDLEELSKMEKLVYPIHPRTKNNLEKIGYLGKIQDNPNIILDDPLGYLEFTCLMANCKYLVTDSGGLQEESTTLDIPCFTLRNNTERPSTLIENHGTNQLISKISEIVLKKCKGSMDLWNGQTSEKILRFILHIEKQKLLILNKDASFIIQEMGLRSKFMTYKFCTDNNIIIPKIYYTNIQQIIGSVDLVFKYDNFVLKIENTCSAQGVYLFIKRTKDNYKCQFRNKCFDKPQIIELIKHNKVIVEESLITYNKNKNNHIIPLDYKVYVIDNEPLFITVFDRNADDKFISTYDMDGNNITFQLWYFAVNYKLKYGDIINENVLYSIKEFINKHTHKLNHNGLISWDLYFANNTIYLGEFTLHPGQLHFGIIKPHYCRMLNSKLKKAMFKNSYNFKTININNLAADLENNKNSNYHYHYQYKQYDFLYKNKRNNNLLVTFHGSRKLSTPLPIFRLFNYEINNYDIMSFSDPYFKYYDALEINWFLSENSSTITNIKNIIDCVKKRYNKIIFYGSSGGGYIALILSGYFNEYALITNSQLYLQKIVEKFEYVNLDNYLITNKPKKIVIYQNIDDKHHYNEHYKIFINNNKHKLNIQNYEFNRNDIKIEYDQHGLGHYPINKNLLTTLNDDFKQNILIIQNNISIGGAQLYGLNIAKVFNCEKITFLLHTMPSNFEINKILKHIDISNVNIIYDINKINEIYDHVFVNSYPMLFKNDLENYLLNIKKFSKNIYPILHNETNRFTLSISQIDKPNIYYNKCLCVFERLKNKLITTNNSNAYVLYPSFDHTTELFDKQQTNTTKILGFYGRILPCKGILLLIKYWKEVYDSYPNWKLKIVGNYTPYSESYYYEIINFIDDNKLCDVVELDIRDINSYEEKKSVFQSFDIFIQLSLYEGFPFTVLESLSFGTPVIHSNVGGLNEIITHRNGGLVDLMGTTFEKFDFIDYEKQIHTNLYRTNFNTNINMFKKTLNIVLNKTFDKIKIMNSVDKYNYNIFKKRLTQIIN
jgi:UDP-N-acetylglucosamine 2-epimerase (non-hydrolysing)